MIKLVEVARKHAYDAGVRDARPHWARRGAVSVRLSQGGNGEYGCVLF